MNLDNTVFYYQELDMQTPQNVLREVCRNYQILTIPSK